VLINTNKGVVRYKDGVAHVLQIEARKCPNGHNTLSIRKRVLVVPLDKLQLKLNRFGIKLGETTKEDDIAKQEDFFIKLMAELSDSIFVESTNIPDDITKKVVSARRARGALLLDAEEGCCVCKDNGDFLQRVELDANNTESALFCNNCIDNFKEGYRKNKRTVERSKIRIKKLQK
jgi:hypothetical protein